ncbi:MBT domain-containing protein 1 [Toxocara canis]|uniref:MBT domain-containing protein 1 n=1 Tax=Toxocara canis TaxID=6265 RepID=A0A0B2VUR7_TOXCA|nr:MBT domain-containing protein 1 [Toxocara canis]
MVRFRPLVFDSSTKSAVVKGSYQWDDYLEESLQKMDESGDHDSRCSNYAVPAECFFEAPFVGYAPHIVPNIKLEIALDDKSTSFVDESTSVFWVANVVKDKTKQSEEQGEASKAVTNLEEPDENKPASKGDDAPTKPDGPQSEEKDKSAKGSKKEEKSNKSKEESKQKSNRNEEKKEGQDGTKKDEEKKDAQKDSRQGKCQKDEEKKEKSTSKNSVNKENVALHPGVENECEKKPENDKQKASKPSAQEGPNDEKSFCAEDTDSRFLVPPMLIAERRTDWQQYLLCQLHAYRTLPAKWPEIQHRNLNNCKFKIGDRVELLDGLVSMRVRPALIEEIVGGRILVKVSAKDMNKADMQVQDDEEEDNQVEEGVWMDQCSPLIFYVGWACKVGYQLLANDAYMKHATEIANALKAGTAKVPFSRQDARPEQFQHYIDCCSEGDDESSFAEWEKGMKLEILDPLDTWKELRVATVIEVLADGYLRLGFDGEEMEEDCIPIHCASPLLFPVGYCEKYGIKLKGPQGEGKFDWKSHLKQSKSVAAPDVLFDDDEQPAILNKFKVGAKLEAVDMCEPHLICVATVAAHKGRLLQIKFDGWDDSYDQLFDYRSNCIFPIGWCEANGYKLEAPRAEMKKKLRGKK